MLVVRDKITIDELKKMSEKMFGQIVKAVIDIEQEIMVVDADMHVDQEEFLLDNGSEQKNLWGINFHPYKNSDEFLEYDSMINLRPKDGNSSRSVDNPEIQKKIAAIVDRLVIK